MIWRNASYSNHASYSWQWNYLKSNTLPYGLKRPNKTIFVGVGGNKFCVQLIRKGVMKHCFFSFCKCVKVNVFQRGSFILMNFQQIRACLVFCELDCLATRLLGCRGAWDSRFPAPHRPTCLAVLFAKRDAECRLSWISGYYIKSCALVYPGGWVAAS